MAEGDVAANGIKQKTEALGLDLLSSNSKGRSGKG